MNSTVLNLQNKTSVMPCTCYFTNITSIRHTYTLLALYHPVLTTTDNLPQ